MAEYQLHNEVIRLTVSDHGAEMKSLLNLKTGREYLWQGDPAFWGRTAPVLFPLVGNYWEKTSCHDGKSYHLSQHGFARDMVFALEYATENSIFFSLMDTADTKEKYPFSFKLVVGYILHGHTVSVLWTVENPEDRTMYFSIGGHPAFQCDLSTDKLLFLKGEECVMGPLVSGIIEGDGSGCLSDRLKSLPLEDGILRLAPELFDEDALIFENGQADQVALLDQEQNMVLRVSFDAPLFGIWSTVKKKAPFVCIEPWYGRTDRVLFSKKLEEREYGNKLDAGEIFQCHYSIHVFD